MNDSISSGLPQRASHAEISQRAEQLWESMGRPVGRDEEIWLQAERELQTPAATPDSAVTTPTPLTTTPPVSNAPAEAPPRSTAQVTAAPRKPSRSSRAAAR